MEYKYAMKYRPFGIGCQPKGFIRVNSSNKMIDGYYSVVVYDRELSEEEVKQYELVKIS